MMRAWAAALLASIACAGPARPNHHETIAEFRRRVSGVLATSGAFEDAARYLRNIDFLGEETSTGRCRPFDAQESQLRTLVVKAHFLPDANPTFLPKAQVPICRAYRRESTCAASGGGKACMFTDALQVCFHSDPLLDGCRFTRAAWAARFRGATGRSAAVVDDDDYRAEVIGIVKTFESEGH